MVIYNDILKRYNLNDTEILNAAKFAYDNEYGSIVLQGGELRNKTFINIDTDSVLEAAQTAILVLVR